MLDISLKTHVRYLGIRVGDITPQGAMAGGLAEALRRTRLIAELRLTLREKGYRRSKCTYYQW